MKGFGLPRKKPPTEGEYFTDLKRKVVYFTVFLVAIIAAPHIIEKVQDRLPSQQSKSKPAQSKSNRNI
eukprot:UN13310